MSGDVIAKGKTTMGKVKDWLIEMEEDASCMTREEWMTKHGETVVDVYDEFKRKEYIDEPDQGDLFDV